MSADSNACAQIDSACRNPEFCTGLLGRLQDVLGGRQLRFMEVCGTHTVSIFQSGLRSLLPANITHLSGPGCPVCVTHDAEVALFLQLAQSPDTMIATFGDLLRVPAPDGQSLKHAAGSGAAINIVYSPLDAVALARANPGKQIVFLGVGFETTAPAVAASIITAAREQLENYAVLSMHKLVPPVLRLLLSEKDNNIDALLLPGHVATVTGLPIFDFVAAEYHKPAAVGGFEPADILLALCAIAEQLDTGLPFVANAYPRAVNPGGNPAAQKMMDMVFEPCPALWRGFGEIPDSGLAIRQEFAAFDALRKLDLSMPEPSHIAGCRCGDVLKGRLQPSHCPLFGKKCTPASPVGPCMVSTEGSCAAYYKYGE